MLIDSFTRFIRRKLVLGIIFGFSLTYCIFSFTKDMYNIDPSPNNEPELFHSQEKLKVFIWNSDGDPKNTSTVRTTCRNSIQGKFLMADDKGYLCKRIDTMTGGCCNITSEFTKRYSCENCYTDHCCSVYESCISCCLNPNKKPLLQDIYSEAHGGLRLIFASITDHFELCLTKCRTNSMSVHHENSYLNPTRKYCYGR